MEQPRSSNTDVPSEVLVDDSLEEISAVSVSTNDQGNNLSPMRLGEDRMTRERNNNIVTDDNNLQQGSSEFFSADETERANSSNQSDRQLEHDTESDYPPVPELTHSGSTYSSDSFLNLVDRPAPTIHSRETAFAEAHSPPNPRDDAEYAQQFNPRGSLRSRIERTQSMRFYPPENFIENLENRLLRFSPSGSGSTNEDLLSGNHPLQAANLTVMRTTTLSNNNEQGRSTSSRDRPSSASRRLSQQIAERNRRLSFSGGFIADIPALGRPPSRRLSVVATTKPPPLLQNSQSETSSSSQSVHSSHVSHDPEFGSSLERSSARVAEEVEEEPGTLIIADSDSTLRIANSSSKETLKKVQPHESLNRSPTLPEMTTDPSTSELLRSWDRSRSIRSTMNASSPENQLVTTSEHLFTSPITANEVTSVTQGSAVPTRVNGFQRSPQEIPQPQTTSARQLDAEELVKGQNRESDDDGNCFMVFWNAIIESFRC